MIELRRGRVERFAPFSLHLPRVQLLAVCFRSIADTSSLGQLDTMTDDLAALIPELPKWIKQWEAFPPTE